MTNAHQVLTGSWGDEGPIDAGRLSHARLISLIGDVAEAQRRLLDLLHDLCTAHAEAAPPEARARLTRLVADWETAETLRLDALLGSIRGGNSTTCFS